MTDAPELVSVYLKDEIKKFKSGERTITVLQLGSKWAHLQCGKKKATIPRSLWIDILARNAKFRNRLAK